jgi:hypothetical protein
LAAEAKRRFTELEVDEVSLVDKPANEVEVLVMKRKEPMENQTNEPAPVTKSAPEASAPEASAPEASAPAAPDIAAGAAALLDEIAGVFKGVNAAVQKAAAPPAAGESPAATDEEGEAFDAAAEKAEGVVETLKAMRLTDKRKDRLRTAYEELKALMDDIEKGPATQVPAGKPDGVSHILKELNPTLEKFERLADVLKALREENAGLRETITKADERIKALEEQPGPPTASSTESSEPVRKSLWAGVL